MTTMELNAELFRQLSVIAEDEKLMKKAVKALGRIVKNKQKEDAETISNEEILKGIDDGLKDLREGRTRPAVMLLEELKRGV